MKDKLKLEDCISSELIDFTKINYQFIKCQNLENYLYIFETIISSNNSKKLSEIIGLLNKIVDEKYINKDILSEFLESEYFCLYTKEHLKTEQIDVLIKPIH